MAGPDPLARALRRVAWRVRLQRTLAHGAALAAPGIGVAAVGVGLLKWGASPERAWTLVACGASLPLAGAGVGLVRPVAPLFTARLVDAAYGLRGLCASAWAFLAVAPAARSAFMHACVRRAEAAAPDTRAARVLPLRAPRGWLLHLALALAVSAVGAWDPPRTVAVARPAPAKVPTSPREEFAALREEVDPLSRNPELDPDLAHFARDLNDILERLARDELDRIAALREIAALEARFDPGAGEDETLREALRGLGGALGKDPAAAPLRESLEEADARKAAEELRRLLREGGQRGARDTSVAARAAERMARAAQKSGSERDATRERQLERLERESKQASSGDDHQGSEGRDGQGRGGESAEERERLLQRERKLDALRKQIEREREARRRMEQLARDLDAAAGALGRGAAEEGADATERAAQGLERMDGMQRSQAERGRMRGRMEQLRGLLSEPKGASGTSPRGGEGRSGRKLDAREFDARAGGSEPSEGAEGTLSGASASGEPTPGAGDAAGAMPAPGASASSQAEGAPNRDPRAQGGREAGRGGRPLSADVATRADTGRVDLRATGEKRAGPTRSEVIVDAARRGFASRDYREVHEDYREHAERVLERDHIPGGYRFYVRRYFELIRPRTAP